MKCNDVHYNVELSLSDTEHGWAHGSNRVYSVIRGFTGWSIDLQTVPGDELVRFRLKCSTSMYEQSTDILNQTRFVTA